MLEEFGPSFLSEWSARRPHARVQGLQQADLRLR
jgi:hypothetical protein